GTSVRVAPGNALIRNSYGGGGAQTYACRAGSETQVPIEATGSSGWRNDLIVARIDDPTYQGGSFDPATFEAARFEVISGVASDQKDLSGLGLSYPAIPLARLNVPPSTGTITESMITDLRSIALPRVQRHLFTYALRTGESDRLLGPVGDVEGEAWPNHYWYFNIPSWAQRVRVRAILGGVRVEEKAPTTTDISTCGSGPSLTGSTRRPRAGIFRRRTVALPGRRSCVRMTVRCRLHGVAWPLAPTFAGLG